MYSSLCKWRLNILLESKSGRKGLEVIKAEDWMAEITAEDVRILVSYPANTLALFASLDKEIERNTVRPILERNRIWDRRNYFWIYLNFTFALRASGEYYLVRSWVRNMENLFLLIDIRHFTTEPGSIFFPPSQPSPPSLHLRPISLYLCYASSRPLHEER